MRGKKAGYLKVDKQKNNHYRMIKLSGVNYREHVLAWIFVNGEIPKGSSIDHINGDTQDNRIKNLRAVSHTDNMRNMKLSKRNTSGVVGVYRKGEKYLAAICVNRKLINAGVFIDRFEAICARKSAEAFYGFHENHGRVDVTQP